jgi:hypothetical protein
MTDFLVDQAPASEHVTALIVLLVKMGLVSGPEYEAATGDGGGAAPRSG